MTSLPLKAGISFGRGLIVKAVLVAGCAAIAAASFSTVRVPPLAAELRTLTDDQFAGGSDIVYVNRPTAAQKFVALHGGEGRTAAEYVAWRYRTGRSSSELSYASVALEVIRTLHSTASRKLLERLSSDRSAAQAVRLDAVRALVELPGTDVVPILTRLLDRGNSAERYAAFYLLLFHQDPRLLPAVERAQKKEKDDHTRGLLIITGRMLEHPGKCVLYGPARQGDGSLSCFYYCPNDTSTVEAHHQAACEPITDRPR